MRNFCAILTGLYFAGVALNGAFGQAGVRVAEPPAVPRSAAPATAPQSPFSMGAYSGSATPPGAYPGAGATVPGAPVVMSPQVAMQAVPAMGADRDKPLGVGDQVTFQIMEDRDPPLSKRVLDTGELDIPYIGRVPAAGKKCDEVAADIKRRLENDYYYKATVRLGLELTSVGRPTGRIYLSGLVRIPGPQDLFPGERTTVSAVILKAGGFAQYANDRQVKVTRKLPSGKTETFTVDVKAILRDGRMDLDRELREGDYLYVPQKLINF